VPGRWAVAHKPCCRVRQFETKCKWKTTFCIKVVGATNLEALIFLQAIQIVAWLHCERVSLHVNSSHFPFLSLSCNILYMGKVSFLKCKWFVQGYMTAVGGLRMWLVESRVTHVVSFRASPAIPFLSVVIGDCAMHPNTSLNGKQLVDFLQYNNLGRTLFCHNPHIWQMDRQMDGHLAHG